MNEDQSGESVYAVRLKGTAVLFLMLRMMAQSCIFGGPVNFVKCGDKTLCEFKVLNLLS